MSAYIKGMNMPEFFDRLFVGRSFNGGIYIRNEREDGKSDSVTWYPVIEIPPHGRLIDADAFALIVQKWRYMYKRIAEETNDDDIVAMAVAIDEFLNSVSLTLGKMQTIIPADKED